MRLEPYLDSPENYEPYDEIDAMSWHEIRDLKHRYEGARDFFEGVVEELYGEDKIDVLRLEGYIEEMASYFKMKMPKSCEMFHKKFKGE